MTRQSDIDPQRILTLFRARFLCRTDVIAFLAPWGKPCPAEVGEDLDDLLLAHVLGAHAPRVILRYRNVRGVGATKGPFRLGAYTPTTEGTTKWLCLDFDGADHAEALVDPKAEAIQTWSCFEEAGIPAYLEQSGGGKGWHLWCFFEQLVAASQVRALALTLMPEEVTLASGETVRTNTGRGIEIFPKQTHIDREGFGNLIWLPWWFGAEDTANQFHQLTADGLLVPYMPEDFETINAQRLDEFAPESSMPAPLEPTLSDSIPTNSIWGEWRTEALAALPLEAVYGEWLTGRPGRQGWLECRDPWSSTGDRNPSAGVSDGSRAQRGEFHTFLTGETLSVFDFLIRRGIATDFTAAYKRIAELSGVEAPGTPVSDSELEPVPVPALAPASTSIQNRPTRPQIRINNRQLRDVIMDGWQAIHAANTPPRLFQRAGLLVRLAIDKTARIEVVDEATIYGFLARAADWVKVTENAVISTYPPHDAARDLLVYPDPSLGRLENVVTAPVFGPQGMLITRPGYHIDAQLWYQPDPDLSIPPVPERPDATQIEAARHLIFNELLVDFPFISPSDLAHVVAALLLPFVRRMITGCTPIHLIESPVHGSGKGLLADAISIIATGHSCEATTVGNDEEETRKKITSLLVRARPIILLDNVRFGIHSSSLASAVTAEIWSDRILGQTRMIDLANQATWLVTANNPTLSIEVARRSIRIRIDPHTDRPWQRGNFRHSPLRDWARKHRGALVHALLILVQAWTAADRPLNSETLGSFERWASIIGGILTTAGIPGFLANVEELYETADVEGGEWREFVTTWWEKYQDQWVRVQDLHDLVLDEGMMGSITGAKSSRSQQIRLGLALRGARDRQFAEWRVLMRHDSHTKSAVYRLAKIEPPDDPTAPVDLATIPEEEGGSYDGDSAEHPGPANRSNDL